MDNRLLLCGAMAFSLYVALGDSMSTDHYPTCDVRNLDAPPGRLDPLGAAALLHSNDCSPVSSS
jgi:hypothetical protein